MAATQVAVADEAISSKTDAGLIMAMRSADVDALAEAYDRHGQFVYGLGVRLCGPRQAEAMTGEVFLALWRSPANFVKSAGSLRAALIADMHRRGASCLRSEHSRHRDATAAPGGAELEQLGRDASADQGQERSPSKLTHDRSPLHLAYFRGYTYNQIAALLGRPKAAVAAELQAQARRVATQME